VVTIIATIPSATTGLSASIPTAGVSVTASEMRGWRTTATTAKMHRR
jgi:hypothetical protein